VLGSEVIQNSKPYKLVDSSSLLGESVLILVAAASIAEEAITDHPSRLEAFPYSWREKPPRL
jgi:hypothetical protein